MPTPAHSQMVPSHPPPPPSPPTKLVYVPSLPAPPSPSQFVDVYSGTGTPRSLVLFLHGGFWKSHYSIRPPTSAFVDTILPSLCATFATVAYVEYRRQPDDNPFSGYPYVVADCVCAYDTLMNHLDPKPNKVIVMGHSAGGMLALMLCMERPVTHTYALAPVANLTMAARLKLSTNGDAVQLYAHGEAGETEAYEQGCPTRMAWKMKDNGRGMGDNAVTLVLGKDDKSIPEDVVRSCHSELIKYRPETRLWLLDGNDHYSIVNASSEAWSSVLEDVCRMIGDCSQN